MRENHSKGPMPNIVIVVVGVFLILLGFGGGVVYQKNQQPKITAVNSGGMQSSPFGGRAGSSRAFSGQRPTVGDVTAISSDSITVKDQISGSDKTLKITSDTIVTNNGETAKVADIKVGDTALIRTSSTSVDTAGRITINPSLNGGPANMPSTQSQNN